MDQEGRPEVCINGIWGSICQYSWNQIDGYIFCNELGFDGPCESIAYLYYISLYHHNPLDPNTYYYSRYGDGYGPAVWSYLYCQGWEKNVFECSKNVYPDANCNHNNIAGVLCKEGTI